jgi:hypothetical protein
MAILVGKEIVEAGGGLEGLALYHAFDELKSDPRYQKLLSQARR